MNKEDLMALRPKLDEFLGEYGDCFAMAKTAKHLNSYVGGQLSAIPRKSVEPMAEEAGVPPRTLQEFLSIHRWSAESMKRRTREIIVRDHADPNAIGLVDDTGIAKKGKKTAGVQRQYCGESGKVDNCVVTVGLGYATNDLHALVDSDLYVPEGWIEDEERCEEAGIPSGTPFRKKWEIALDLIDRTRADGVPLKWITSDEGYGEVPDFHGGLGARGLLTMLEVPCSMSGWTPRGKARGKKARRADALWGRGGPSWELFRIKETDRGPLVWRARVTRFLPTWDPENEYWLVIAEHVLTGELKYFLSNAPEDAPITVLLTVAFSRWRIERIFQDSKQEIGLNHFEVRIYSALQRHFAISMVSLLFLTRIRRIGGADEGIANLNFVTAPTGDRGATRLDPLSLGPRPQARTPPSKVRTGVPRRRKGQTLSPEGHPAAAEGCWDRSASGTPLPEAGLALSC